MSTISLTKDAQIKHDYSKFNLILQKFTNENESDPWKGGEYIIQLIRLKSNLLQNLPKGSTILLWEKTISHEEVSKEFSEKIDSAIKNNASQLFSPRQTTHVQPPFTLPKVHTLTLHHDPKTQETTSQTRQELPLKNNPMSYRTITKADTIRYGLLYCAGQLNQLSNEMEQTNCQYKDFDPLLSRIASDINKLVPQAQLCISNETQSQIPLVEAAYKDTKELLHLRCLIFINQSLHDLHQSIAGVDEESLLANFPSIRATFNKNLQMIGDIDYCKLSLDNHISLKNSHSFLKTCEKICKKRLELFYKNSLSANNKNPLSSILNDFFPSDLHDIIFTYSADETWDLDLLSLVIDHLNNNCFYLARDLKLMPSYLKEMILSKFGKNCVDPEKFKEAVTSVYRELTIDKFMNEIEKNGLKAAKTVYEKHLIQTDAQNKIDEIDKFMDKNSYTMEINKQYWTLRTYNEILRPAKKVDYTYLLKD